MKVAIVHDYIREYGGAERVLEALCEAFPDAPIYTAFIRADGRAYERFKGKTIHQSWAANIPFFATKLHSPLRFLAPLIWNSFNFSEYDVVITSASWYITKGVIDQRQKTKDKRPIEICYCHTPPRWLYGYKTSVELQKYWPVRIYAAVIGHFMRMYDYNAAQRVDYFLANSKETAKRIEKFYRRKAIVIYPPVSLGESVKGKGENKREDYYFMVARLTGAKGLDIAVKAAIQGEFKLKIAGESGGYYTAHKDLMRIGKGHVEFLGYVSDEELVTQYKQAKAFFALATDEDFGITPVEAMLCGTPVIACNGGGYKETVIDGKTGVLFDEATPEGLIKAVKRFETLQNSQGKKQKMKEDCIKQAEKFSKERFIKEIQTFVKEKVKK
jgi:glycosyltransferase involved in cell wall biosynthesis